MLGRMSTWTFVQKHFFIINSVVIFAVNYLMYSSGKMEKFIAASKNLESIHISLNSNAKFLILHTLNGLEGIICQIILLPFLS